MSRGCIPNEWIPGSRFCIDKPVDGVRRKTRPMPKFQYRLPGELMRVLSRYALPLCFVAAMAQPVHAALLDQTLSATFYYPDAATPYAGAAFSPQTFAVGTGQESVADIEGVTFLSIDVSADQVTIQFHTALSAPTWGTAEFNGIAFTSTSAANLGIAGASVNGATTLAGFDSSRLSFGTSWIAIDWNGLSYRDGQKLMVDFQFSDAAPLPITTASPVPELSILAIVALGTLAGWSTMRRHLKF